LHNEDLRDWFSSAEYYQGVEMKGVEVSRCARVGNKACIQCFGWEREGKTPLVSHRHRWEDIIKMYHKSVKCEIVDGDHLAEDGYMFL
jgi:hypothetical protein